MYNRTDTSFFSRWWHNVDRVSLFIIASLVIFGAIMVATASPSVATRINLSPNHFLYRHLIFIMLGFGLIATLSMLPIKTIRRIGVLGFLAALMGLLLVYFGGADSIKGANRWIRIMGISVQPSEFIKPCFVIVCAWMFSEKLKYSQFPGNSVAIILYLIVASLIITQPDLGMTIIITLTWFAQFFLSGLKIVYIIILITIAIFGLILAYTSFPHFADRIDKFLDPAGNENFQGQRSLEAIQNGGLIGQGPGEGTYKLRIPDSHTDFIYPVIIEEGGVIAGLFIIAIFSLIFYRTTKRIMQSNNLFVILAAYGLVLSLTVQALVNIGVSLGVLPTTGMTLPLISYGGSSTLANCLSIGMLLGLTRKSYGN